MSERASTKGRDDELASASCPHELDEAARAAFEAHYRLAYDLTRTGEWGNGYVHDGIEAMWKGWRECWPAAVAAERQRCADIVEDLIGDGESVRFALHAIRNPLERGGASSLSTAGIVWFGFDEGTGEFTGEYSTVRPHNTHGMVPFVRASRGAVADDDLHDELVDQIELETASEALLDDEPGTLARRIRQSVENGTFSVKSATDLGSGRNRADAHSTNPLSEGRERS